MFSSYNIPLPPAPAAPTPLDCHDVSLEIRQQPKEALVTAEGKEKARKPVDPPPIIQLKVRSDADPQKHFLQSPYLFLCVSLWHHDRNEPHHGNGKTTLAGTLVSSIHRLKDVDNNDGGFFVFGDVSVKMIGTHRLHFSLFDLHKETADVFFLGSITSDSFRVLAPKDFKGMDESTYLSRAFSDQGVRLRLRKEPRTMGYGGHKRGYPYNGTGGQESNDASASSSKKAPADEKYGNLYSEETPNSPNKRQRSAGDHEDEDQSSQWEQKPQISDRTSGLQTPFPQSQLTSLRPSSVFPTYSSQMTPAQASYAPSVTQKTTAYPYRLPSSSSYRADNLMSPVGVSQYASQQRYQDMSSPYSQNYSSSYGQLRGSNGVYPFSNGNGHGYRTGVNTLSEVGDGTQGMSQAFMPQDTHLAHPSPHDSLTSTSRDNTYSQSPDLLRSNYNTDSTGGLGVPQYSNTISNTNPLLAGYRPSTTPMGDMQQRGHGVQDPSAHTPVAAADLSHAASLYDPSDSQNPSSSQSHSSH